MEKYSDLDCYVIKFTQQGQIRFVEHKEAETQNITPLPPVSQLLENAQRQIR